MIYKFKDGSHLPNGKAQKVGERLERIRSARPLTPETVLDDARSHRSPIHELIEWNDEVAAEEYRISQARHILQCVVVEMERPDGDKVQTRAFVVVSDSGGESQYENVRIAMQDESMRKQVLYRAWKELESWRKRYSEIEELAQVFQSIDATAEAVKGAA